jgi:GTP-binding protein
MFIDEVLVDLLAGDGGSGMCAFRRESRVPKGGPSGGDGGRGGSIYVVAHPGLWTLLDFTYHRRWMAGNGGHGGPNQETGKSAEDVEMPVPLGTEVRDADGVLLGEVLEEGDRLLVAKGGRGGQGNQHFATPTHQAPHEFQPGEDGQHRRIKLTLKLIAHVGLLGEPNAGKSTLLATVTAARPKVAAYPFTTLEPNLGVVSLSGQRSYVIADIPGIIEGAHAGKGLGLQFLRHVERTRLLVLMVPLDAPDLAASYAMLRTEAERFSPVLAAKPHCVAWTKADLVPEGELPPLPPTPDAFAQFVLSSVSHRGLEVFLDALWRRLAAEGAAEEAPVSLP